MGPALKSDMVLRETTAMGVPFGQLEVEVMGRVEECEEERETLGCVVACRRKRGHKLGQHFFVLLGRQVLGELE